MPVQMQTRGQAQASPPKLINDILADESLFGDGTPLWEQEPTADEANRERPRLIKRLRRFAAEYPGAAELADRLNACRPKHRCTSGACPECARAFQRWLVLQLQRVSHAPRDHQKPTELVAVSITLPSWRTPPSDLGEFDAGGIRKELIEALDSTQQVKWAVFGLDISMNDDTNKGFDVAWQLQLYGFAHVEDRLTFSKSLRQGFGHE